jgi:hypothetical protein
LKAATARTFAVRVGHAFGVRRAQLFASCIQS